MVSGKSKRNLPCSNAITVPRGVTPEVFGKREWDLRPANEIGDRVVRCERLCFEHVSAAMRIGRTVVSGVMRIEGTVERTARLSVSVQVRITLKITQTRRALQTSLPSTRQHCNAH